MNYTFGWFVFSKITMLDDWLSRVPYSTVQFINDVVMGWFAVPPLGVS